MGAGYKIKPGLPVVRARVRAFTRFGFPCSNPDPAVELLSGVRARLRDARCRRQKEKRPLSLLCRLCFLVFG